MYTSIFLIFFLSIGVMVDGNPLCEVCFCKGTSIICRQVLTTFNQLSRSSMMANIRTMDLRWCRVVGELDEGNLLSTFPNLRTIDLSKDRESRPCYTSISSEIFDIKTDCPVSRIGMKVSVVEKDYLPKASTREAQEEEDDQEGYVTYTFKIIPLFCASITVPSFVVILTAILKHVIEKYFRNRKERRARNEAAMEMLEYDGHQQQQNREVNIYIFLYFQ